MRAVLDIAQLAVEAARRAGADFADARAGTDESESITVRDDAMEGVDRSVSTGIGIRVLAGGRWGFAATARLDEREIATTAELAVRIARAASRLPGDPVVLSPVEPVSAAWSTPVERDPFEVPLGDKIELLLGATAIARAQQGVTYSEAFLDLFRRSTSFASSDGAAIEQTITNAGAGLQATAVGDDDVQVRSYPDSFRGHHRAAGWEHIVGLDLAGNAERVGREAAELLRAPACPSEVTTLVLDANQMELQIHESVGHATELDRVLGMELAFAGGSFVKPDDLGRLRYASPLVTIVADATLPGGLGTFGYDDEGVPAQRTPLVEDGILAGFLTNRETAPAIGAASNATARADGWTHLPLIRMTNVSIEPREGTLEEIIADTPDGMYMSTNTSWSIDDHRINFQFGCEYARRIENGELTQLYKNPNYTGITPEFWGSCDAVGGPASFVVYGTPNCGKGQPGQTARVGHGAAPARFRGVQIGIGG
jgi:TldD protein